MTLLKILILSVIQGFTELLPVSSSAHVIVAERLLGLDPTAPEMTLLLVLLHTGTMLAVIVYFRKAWRNAYFASSAALGRMALNLVLATALTGLVGLALQAAIKHWFAGDAVQFEIEQIFGNLHLIAASLALVGVLIIASSFARPRSDGSFTLARAGMVGLVQGLCLPLRGFSRSGATISTALISGIPRQAAEEFSFALAVVLTPFVVGREAWRFLHAKSGLVAGDWLGFIWPGLLGLLFSFAAGLVALRWLSSWLGTGRWHWFGVYCLAAAGFAWWLGS
ncbi:undecaprenyl-diphosphate phosphatase [Aestuariivirga litoralis]|uniref:undecaprenyl-diphosphate phosphatase n=1 Tax=Aestuariivirga litoralis TaxID=2650924 RepID=UPI0018C70239|nr:undecaprenyl-diphosphate phosphatase [Aestuariivirga litoralis]MBG1233946.1 undecaprenyl-diphosphate phosphatase [Aestuariivirga litoralis]